MLATGRPRTRREALRDIGISAAALLSYSASPSDAASRHALVRGRVRDAESPSRGLPGVMVSNGRDVVLSDRDGAYALPVLERDMVFAIKPPHWTYAGAAGIPHLSYRVDSIGREESFVPTVRPGARNADFAFLPSPEAHDFDALLFTDTHAGDARELGFVRDMIRHGRETSSASFAIHHGDALADDFAMFPAYRRMLEESATLWHHCPGNHDMRLGMRDERLSVDAWTREMGPAHYAFRHGKATFILLNNVGDLGPRAARHDPRPYRGIISRAQLRFVANVLAHVPNDDLIVVSMHIPLVSYVSPNAPTDTTINRAALMRLLRGRPNTISFSGHSHTTEHHYLGKADGVTGDAPHHHHVLTAACGSWWSGPIEEDGMPMAVSRDGSPKGHHVLSVRGTAAETRFVPYRPERQVRTLLEERRLLGLRGVATALVNGRLVVNVFDGGPRTKVSCRIGDHIAEPLMLTRTATEDPFTVETFARDRTTMKPWVYPASCSHLWTVDLPGTLPPGTHRITVSTEGEFGTHHHDELTITV